MIEPRVDQEHVTVAILQHLERPDDDVLSFFDIQNLPPLNTTKLSSRFCFNDNAGENSA